MQGTRDSFGLPEDVETYKLSRAIRIEWLEDGDHSFKPRARSGRTEADNVRDAIALVVDFIAARRHLVSRVRDGLESFSDTLS